MVIVQFDPYIARARTKINHFNAPWAHYGSIPIEYTMWKILGKKLIFRGSSNSLKFHTKGNLDPDMFS